MGTQFKRQDLTGRRFGSLIVTNLSHSNEKYVLFWNCKCDCGGQIIVRGTNLKTRHTTSCGCARRISTPEADQLRQDIAEKCINSVEHWLPINGYNGFYEVSNIGRIRSLDRLVDKGKFGVIKVPNRILKQVLSNVSDLKVSYLNVNLFINGKGLKQAVHRLVAIAFIPNPGNKPQVNHKNGIKTDNRVENLEWVTAQENSQHAYDTGLSTNEHLLGENNKHSVLTEQDVFIIRNSRYKISRKALSRMFGVSVKHIDRVRSRERWRHI